MCSYLRLTLTIFSYVLLTLACVFMRTFGFAQLVRKKYWPQVTLFVMKYIRQLFKTQSIKSHFNIPYITDAILRMPEYAILRMPKYAILRMPKYAILRMPKYAILRCLNILYYRCLNIPYYGCLNIPYYGCLSMPYY